MLKCPKCKKQTVSRESTSRLVKKEPIEPQGNKIISQTQICNDCYRLEKELQKKQEEKKDKEKKKK
jgi:hypothetical protein